jgi:LuxR family maltose regulon positive regulatory protein
MRMRHAHSGQEQHPDLITLTRRQLGMLECLYAGMRPAQIAEQLHLALATVRMHIRHVNERLGTHSYHAAVLEARRLGLLRPHTR